MEYRQLIQKRWADLDPNFHLRHSVYYDYGTLLRLQFLHENGVTTELMLARNFGPVLFREEAVFKREVKFSDPVYIDLHLLKSRRDYSRWTMQHRITKEDGSLCCIITIDGAWFDTKERKLAAPLPEVTAMMLKMPKAEAFTWLD